MQVMSASLSLSPSFNRFCGTRFPEFAGNFTHDFGVNEGKEEEFSFVCLIPDGSPISAEDVLQNGQILSVFPLFKEDLLFADENGSVLMSEVGDVSLRPPLKKIFVEDSPHTKSSSSSEPGGPYCEWRRGGKTVKGTSPGKCKKCNSTGFSKLWRLRNLMLRSNSDGKDAFVFLNHPPSTASSVKTEKKNEKEEKTAKVKVTREKPMVKKEKSRTTASLSAHEKLYLKNRAMREGDKRRSYLPYRQVGFFTNVDRLSRNVHPF